MADLGCSFQRKEALPGSRWPASSPRLQSRGRGKPGEPSLCRSRLEERRMGEGNTIYLKIGPPPEWLQADIPAISSRTPAWLSQRIDPSPYRDGLVTASEDLCSFTPPWFRADFKGSWWLGDAEDVLLALCGLVLFDLIGLVLGNCWLYPY